MHFDSMRMYEKEISQSTCDKQLILNKLVFEMDFFGEADLPLQTKGKRHWRVRVRPRACVHEPTSRRGMMRLQRSSSRLAKQM